MPCSTSLSGDVSRARFRRLSLVSRSLGLLSPRYRLTPPSTPVLLSVLAIGEPMLRSMNSAPFRIMAGLQFFEKLYAAIEPLIVPPSHGWLAVTSDRIGSSPSSECRELASSGGEYGMPIWFESVVLLADGDLMNSGFFNPDNASTAILVSGSSILMTLGARIVLSSELSTLSVAIGLPSGAYSDDPRGGADGTEGNALRFSCPF